jgi:hypothetical protein
MNRFYKIIYTKRGDQIKVDIEDFNIFNKYRWYLSGGGYAIRTIRVNGKKKIITMHREIASVPQGLFTDHINRDRLDNRRLNLRVCTALQNTHNRSIQSNNRVGFKGVKIVTDRKNLYKAQITVNGKKTTIGYFKNPMSAAIAYDEVAKKEFGEFAHLNFS